jgi:hypothetical protein
MQCHEIKDGLREPEFRSITGLQAAKDIDICCFSISIHLVLSSPSVLLVMPPNYHYPSHDGCDGFEDI